MLIIPHYKPAVLYTYLERQTDKDDRGHTGKPWSFFNKKNSWQTRTKKYIYIFKKLVNLWDTGVPQTFSKAGKGDLDKKDMIENGFFLHIIAKKDMPSYSKKQKHW